MSATTTRYHEVARILHWLIAALIVLQYVLAEMAEDASSDLQELALLANHKSVGMTVFMLAIVRIVWRFTHTVPPLPESMPRWQVRASNLSHVLLYLLIFALPVSGWLFSSATAYSVSWFGIFVFPDLIGGDKSLAEVLEEVHEILAKVLFFVALLHILAALKHGLLNRDGVLSRMSSWLSIGLFLVAIVVGVWQLSVPAPSADKWSSEVETDVEKSVEKEQATRSADHIAPAAPVMIDTSLPPWNIDKRMSYIRFTADQAGAPFTGSWPQWSADVRFEPDDLAASSASVRVDTTSPATGDSERDATLVKPEWFDSSVHPEVIFRTIAISAVDTGGYLATGTLRIRNSEHPIRLTFTHQHLDGKDTITGVVKLDRIELGVGTGEWTDTSWVGQHVKVEFQVTGTQ